MIAGASLAVLAAGLYTSAFAQHPGRLIRPQTAVRPRRASKSDSAPRPSKAPQIKRPPVLNPSFESRARALALPPSRLFKEKNLTGIDRIEALSRMNATQRREALSAAAIGPDERASIDERLSKLDKLTPGERDKLFDRYRKFKELPAEEQEVIRNVMRQFHELPESRRQIVKSELDRLRGMPHAERQKRVDSKEYRQRFSPQERAILQNTLSLP